MTRRDVPQNPPGTSGLKRHAALVELSRDHHGVLVEALGLRRAAAGHDKPAVYATAESFLHFYDVEIRGHAADEEEVLLPLAGKADPEGAERIRAEHAELHALCSLLRDELAGGADAHGTLQAIGELLDDHVRFEERRFFMRVQEQLTAVELDDLGEALARHRRARGRAPSCPPPPRV